MTSYCLYLSLLTKKWCTSSGIQTLGRRTHGHRSLDYHRMTAVFSTAGHLTKYVLLDKSLQIFFFSDMAPHDCIYMYFAIDVIVHFKVMNLCLWRLCFKSVKFVFYTKEMVSTELLGFPTPVAFDTLFDRY